jgi:hypothetical protein
MRRYLAVAIAGTMLVVLLSLAFREPLQEEGGRFVVYDADQSLPMLLDTRTGRIWFRQFGAKDAAGNSTGLVWTPVRITPSEPRQTYSLPN